MTPLWPHLATEFERLDQLIDDAFHPGEGRAAAMCTRDEGSPIARAALLLGLNPLEQDLLLLGLAPEADTRYQSIFGVLQELRHTWPTAALAARVLNAAGGPSLHQILTALGGDGRLARTGLIRTLPAAEPSHLVTRPYAMSAAILHFLLGLDRLPADLARIAIRTIDARPASEPLSSATQAALEPVAALLASRSGTARPVALLVGELPDVRSAATLLAEHLGRPLLSANTGSAALADALPDLALYLRLFPHALLLHGPAEPDDVVTCIARLESADAPTFVACRSRAIADRISSGMRSVTIALGADVFEQREEAWNRALAAERIYLAPDDRLMLADRFSVSPAQMSRAVQAAVDASALETDARPFATAVVDATRRLLESRAVPFATKVSGRATWSDLVLPPAVAARLHELAGAIRHSRVVYRDWEFDRRTAGTGVKAMFAGPSGTGKTMTAAVIASELGFDLYRIDLARIVSKYVGETEKHLDEIFSAAAGGQAILLFDEADALFGKRSEVNDAHDRYANIEVSFLLQRLEDHPGVVILATNLRGNIDEAFARRLHYVIDFPRPDPVARAALWRRMFSERVPIAADVDWTFLASQFPLSGGEIRNVALDAAFLAAQNGRVVSMKHLVRAIGRQVAKEGKMPSAAAFQHYHSLVAAD